MRSIFSCVVVMACVVLSTGCPPWGTARCPAPELFPIESGEYRGSVDGDLDALVAMGLGRDVQVVGIVDLAEERVTLAWTDESGVDHTLELELGVLEEY